MAKTSAQSSVSSSEEIIWLETDDGDALGVKNGKLIARNATLKHNHKFIQHGSGDNGSSQTQKSRVLHCGIAADEFVLQGFGK